MSWGRKGSRRRSACSGCEGAGWIMVSVYDKVKQRTLQRRKTCSLCRGRGWV